MNLSAIHQQRWRSTLVLGAMALGLLAEGLAADWPRFRGEGLSATSSDSILLHWPANGLGVVWRMTAPGGYSSVAVCGTRVFTLTTAANNEWCVALDGESGTQLWSQALGSGAAYSTPSVKDGRVYAYSGQLKLFCLSASTGSVLWQRDLMTEYGGSTLTDLNSQSPWVEDGRVFVSVMAATNCLYAFNATNGALLWRGHTNALTHGSPAGATLGSVRQVIFPDAYGLVSVAQDNGRLLWRYSQGYSPGRHGPSPVVQDDIVVCLKSDSSGGGAFRVLCNNGVFSTSPLWADTKLGGTYATVVIHEGYLYTVCSYPKGLTCLNLVSGQTQWSTNIMGVTTGPLILADNHLVVLGPNGQLFLAEASPVRYSLLSKCAARPSGSGFDNSPAFCNGRLYLRSASELVCLDAAIPAALRLGVSNRPGGQIRLTLSSADGRPIYTNRVPQIGLCWSSDLGAPLSGWSPLSGVVFDNGMLRCDETIVSNGPPRFYMGVEQGR